MRSARKRGIGALLGAMAWMVPAPAHAAGDALSAGFRNPPASARPHTWWHWCNGNISRAGITADLEAMKQVGIGGAQIFHVDVGLPAGPVGYNSPAWRAMIGHAVKEAGRLGIELCIHNCAGWSSSGGPWIRPEHAMQMLTWSERTVRGPARFSEVLAQPQPRQTYEERVPYYRDIAVLAFRTPASGQVARIEQIEGKAAFQRADRLLPDLSPTPPGTAIEREEILVLTDRMEPDGRLTWDVPEGEWTILRFGHTPTGKDNHPAPPEGRGLECDKLSREALEAHWKGMMAQILADLGPLAGRVLNNALIDSYEVGSQNWTPKFREEFRRRRGYDLLPFLPVLTGRVVESREVSERFLWDFRRTIADLYADNYFGYFGQLCRRHGMRFSTEPYGNGPFDNIQCGGLADIPMGEFWVGGAAIETAKLAASAAHTHGRRIVGAESFTADWVRGRWLVEPYSIKALGDLVFCNGVNRYIFHRYAHQPWKDLQPGLTMGPWGMHLERTITWWKQAPAWLRYVARCQYLLQAGRFVADACYFTGEEAPNDLPYRPALRPALPPGYDYDGCDTTALLRMSVRNGRITLPDGMSYRVLILPDSPFMTPTVLRKIRDLVRAGATVIGPRPHKSPSLTDYPQCDAEVEQMAEEVWDDCDGRRVKEHRFGRGRVIWGKTLSEVFAQMGAAPDFEYRGASRFAQLAYIHRVAAGADIYFVSNQRYLPEEVECTFRVSGGVPELWHPDTGAIEEAPVWRERVEENGRLRSLGVRGVRRVTVSLRLDPAGSVFVVFRGRRAGAGVRQAGRADHLVAVERRADRPSPAAQPRLQIRRAFYEAPDGSRGADVTERVAALVAEGQTAIPATNALFGDPVPNVVKQLRVEYLLDGKPMQKTVRENETLELGADAERAQAPMRWESAFPSYELLRKGSGAVVLRPWQPGEVAVRTARGKAVKVAVREAARAIPLSGPWTLRFPTGRGAPDQVRLNRLISWTEHPDPGVRYFSGTAEYTLSFDVPARMLGAGRALALDLGRVKHFAEVRLNGRDLGILWKAPFRVEVTGLVKPGRNTLSLRVTNLWPNRLIGDEQLPEEVEWSESGAIRAWPAWLVEGKPRLQTGRITFTTWRFYRKDSPLLESGLLGPVVLRSVREIPLR